MKEKKLNKILFFILMLVLYAGIGVTVVYFLYHGGMYPSGSDTMCHVYKGKKLYQEILQGNWYPLLDMRWYNGVQMMRYWAPLPVYVMAGCIALAGGSEMTGYLIYVFVVAFFGAVTWLLIGYSMKREKLGAFLGALWFFMPNNLFAMFYEGNLPRSLSMIFLPWLFYQCHSYIAKKKIRYLVGIMGTFSLLTLCHLGYAGMVLLAMLLFFVVSTFAGEWRKALHCLISMILGITLVGIWVYPSLQGGISSMDSSEVMAGFFQNLFTTINPILRLKSIEEAFYFGLAAVLVGLAGIMAGRKNSKYYFATALLILFLTSTAMYPILARLPIGQYLWMLRFISIALAMILFGLLLWDSLKTGILIGMLALLVLDCVPSMQLITGFSSGNPVESRMDRELENTLLSEAKEMTKSRLALIDASSLGATGAYLSSDYNKDVNITFGAGWQSAATAENIMMLNQAAENGAYLYLFDRALGLGNDTVLIKKSLFPQTWEMVLPEIKRDASRVGYQLVDQNEEYCLFHRDTPECFGVITDYSAIGIGKAAREFSLFYPAMKETQDTNLNHYSFEELCKYKMVYLDGFTYSDKEAAEELVRRLAHKDVRIVINGTGIPVDEYSGIQSFLGVVCQPIYFSNGYPLLETFMGELDTTLFPVGFTKWRTVYLEGLDRSLGEIDELGDKLSFLGKAGGSENIYVVGLGLSYYYSLTKDKDVGALLDFVLQRSENIAPKNQVVPITVESYASGLLIQSEYDNVNTTLAYHDIFRSESPIWESNQLLYVDAGETRIHMGYPYWKEGLLVSAVSLLVAGVFLMLVKGLWSRHALAQVAIYGIDVPREGEKPDFEALVPKGAKYRIRDLTWRRTEVPGEEEALSRESVFKTGKYRVAVTVAAQKGEEFAKQVDVTINGFAPNEYRRIDAGEFCVELEYYVREAFHFTKQPRSVQGYEGDELSVAWSLSEEARVSYLQVKEQEKWTIVGVVPSAGNEQLRYSFDSDIMGKNLYRIVVIQKNGRTSYSEEFTVYRRRGIRMRVLVTGVKGQLGYDVVNELESRGMEAVGVDIEEMDITDASQVEKVITESKVDAVIHCAAYTAVDAAEENEAVCRKINVGGTENIARVCKKLSIKMMYISTDYVFNGEGETPWEPDDEAHPKSVYGQTKYEGEQAVTSLLDKYFIVRIAWVFGINGKNFVRTMLRVGKTHDTLTVVNDQYGSPTYTFDLAKLLVDMIATDKYGIYHATNEGICTWYDFACAIFKEAGMDVVVKPVTSEEYGAKANRPSNSRMSKEKLVENGFHKLPAWQDALHRYVQELKKEEV